MKNKLSYVVFFTLLTAFLTACDDSQEVTTSDEQAAKALDQKNNKVESAEEIYKRLHSNNPNNYEK